MTERAALKHYMIFFGVFLVGLAIFESSFWLPTLGFLPAPMLWLSVFTYVCIYCSLVEAVILIYGAAFFITFLTSFPLGLFICIATFIVLGIQFIKDRIFWSEKSYFALVNIFSIFSFHILHFIFSQIIEDNPVNTFRLLYWVGQSLMFLVFMPLIFVICDFISPHNKSLLADKEVLIDV